MQSFGSQSWDASFTIQALLASDLTNEIGPILARGHNFIKISQVGFSVLKKCHYPVLIQISQNTLFRVMHYLSS